MLIESYCQTLVLRIITFYSIINNIFSHDNDKDKFYSRFFNYHDKTQRDFYCHMQIYQKNIINFKKKHVFDKIISKYFFHDDIKI